MYTSIFFNLSQSSESLNKTIKYYKSGEANKTAMASLARQTFGCEPFSWKIATTTAVLEGRDVMVLAEGRHWHLASHWLWIKKKLLSLFLRYQV